MPGFIRENKTVAAIVFIVCCAVAVIFLYKFIRALAGRIGYYSALKKYCRQNGGNIKKNNPLLRSLFRAYPGYDIEMELPGRGYGIKFFPKCRKNRRILIEDGNRACLLKNTGVMGVSWRGSLPGVRTLTPDVITEVIARRIKIDLSGTKPGFDSILLFSPKCRSVSCVKKAERADAYNGDEICGYTVFYKKSNLMDHISNDKKEV